MTAAPDDGDGLLDGQDLAAVVEAHGDDLFRFALHLTRERELARDLAHDTLLRAWERRRQFRGDASLRTWLHRILHNLAVDRMRRSAREVVVEEVDARWRDDAWTVDTEAVVQRAALRDPDSVIPADVRDRLGADAAARSGNGEAASNG